jgi:hypothetical protein
MAQPAQILGPSDQDSDESSTRPNLRALEGGGQTSSPSGSLHAVPSQDPYDDEEEGASDGSPLTAIHGGGETSEPKQGHLSAVKDGEKEGAKGPGSALGAAGAGEMAGKAADVVGKGFNPEVGAALSGLQKAKNAIWGGKKQKRRTLISGGAIGGVVLIFTLLFAFFLPNTIVSLMSDLENRAFAVVEHDLEQEMQKELQHFLRDEVFQTTNVCGPTTRVTKFYKCIKQKRADKQKNNAKTAEEDPIEGKGGLMDAWVNSDLTGQFAQKGITFSEEGGKYFINSADLAGGKLDVTDFVKNDKDLFELIGEKAPAFTETFKAAMDALVVVKGSFLHVIFTKLLAYLYGIRWCVMDCNPGDEQQDRAKDTVADKEDTLKAEEYQKVIEPTAAVEGQAVQDVISGNDPSERDSNGQSAAQDISGGDTTKGDKAASEAIDKVATTLGSQKLNQLIKGFNDLQAKGTQYMALAVAKALSALPGVDIGAETITKVMGGLIKAINIAGLVQMAIQFLHVLLNANTIIPADYNKIHAAFEVSEFALYAATGAEQKSGGNHPDLTMLGSIAKGFSASDKNGNPSSALQSPMMQRMIDRNNTKYSDKDVHNDLEAKHFALDGGSNDALTKISKDLNFVPGLNWLVSKLNWALNIALGPVTWLMSQAFKILGINSLISKVATPLMGWISEKLFAMPDLMHMSGEDRGTAVAMGADISGNQAARSVGGKVDGKAAAISLLDQEQEDQRQFESRPLFARMFATDTPYSFVSRLSLNMPLSFGSALQTSFSTLIENPLGKLFGSFASVLHPGNAFAVATSTANVDVGGVEQYVVPDNDPVFQQDPEAYWKAHNCEQEAKQDYPTWNKAVKWNPTTGQWEHTTTNGCLLIQRTSESAAVLFGGLNDGSNTNASTSTTTNGGCSGGKYGALVGSGSSFAGVDQGIDFVPSGGGSFNICAPAAGTITLADQTGHHFNRTTGQAEIIETLDQNPGAPSSSQFIYYAEIIQLAPGITVGATVQKGDLIGTSNQSPGIEVGWGLSKTEGFMCPIGYPTACGTSFNNWVQAQ